MTVNQTLGASVGIARAVEMEEEEVGKTGVGEAIVIGMGGKKAGQVKRVDGLGTGGYGLA